jgi:hypothetical protein
MLALDHLGVHVRQFVRAQFRYQSMKVRHSVLIVNTLLEVALLAGAKRLAVV